MTIEWTAELETGIAEVDQDHRRLVGLINELDALVSGDGDPGRVGEIIDALVDYTDYHFHREEGLLNRAGYAAAAAHARLHAGFGQFLGGMVGACMLDPGPVTARRLTDYLHSWLVDHILVEDKKFAAALRSQTAPQG